MSRIISQPPTRSTRAARILSPPMPRVSSTLGPYKGLEAASRQTNQYHEKRQSPRRDLHCSALLIDEFGGKGLPRAIPAQCTNVSNSGLFAIVPMGYGVAIGQRYAFQLAIQEHGTETRSRQTIAQQGEIMRVELQFGEDGYANEIGIGVRLSGPRYSLQ